MPARDTEALAAALVRVATLAWILRSRVAEIDINPLLVRPRGAGVVAADALIVLRPADTPAHAPHTPAAQPK